MTTAFPKSTPAAQVKPHRHAWATGKDTVHQVISRDGKTRYDVILFANGDLRCTCEAGKHGRRCWHQEKVAARIIREGVPESITNPQPTAEDLWDRL